MKKTLILTIAALALTWGVLWHSHRPPAAPPVSSWELVKAEAQAGGYRLISTAELADRYRRDPQGLLLVDTRQEWEYRTGHLQGAVNFPLEPTWWGRFRAQGPLAALLGPDKHRFLVFY